VKLAKDLFFAALGYLFGRRRHLRMPGDVFRRKLVITVPRWGVPIIALAVAIPLVVNITYIANVVEVVVVLTCVTVTMRLVRIVNGIKYEVRHILHGIDESEDDERYAAWMDKPEGVPTLNLKRAGNGSKRVSKSG
jgi:hypothetical protein